MPKRPRPGRCVHCLETFAELTWDHLLPKAWYPDSTPENLEKWKFPSCYECNNKYGQLERELLYRLGMCIDPKDAQASGITEKVLRSLNPECASNENDANARRGEKEKILLELKEISDPNVGGILPGFGIQAGVEYPSYKTIGISMERLKLLTLKMVRGLIWLLQNGRFIENDYEITTSILKDKDAIIIYSPFIPHGQIHCRGPGLTIWHSSASDEPGSSMFIIEIWGKLKLYAGVNKRVNDQNKSN